MLCWSHGWSNSCELADIAANERRGKRAPPISPVPLEPVQRIDASFDIEPEVNDTGGFAVGICGMRNNNRNPRSGHQPVSSQHRASRGLEGVTRPQLREQGKVPVAREQRLHAMGDA